MRKTLPFIFIAILVSTPAFAQARRYYANSVFSWWPQYKDISLFQKFVDESKQKGMNSISIDIPWSIEDASGNYDFTATDARIDYIVSRNMSVFIRVNMTTLGKQVPHWLTEEMLMRTEDGKVYRRESDGVAIPSIAHPVVRGKMVRFAEAVARRYGERFKLQAVSEHPISALSVGFNTNMEADYVAGVDFSQAAKDDFARWIKGRYKTLSSLNSLWGTEYAGCNEIDLAKAHPTAQHLYYQYTLERLFDELAIAVRRAQPDVKLGIQAGCLWDNHSRRTTDIARLLKNMDWLFVSHVPAHDHGFSSDHMRTVAGGRKVANQVDGPTQIGATSGRYFNQSYRTFQHGCEAVILSDWGLENLRDYTKWPFLHDIGALARKSFTPPSSEEAIYMSSWDLINNSAKAEDYISLYSKLTDEGKNVIDVVDDSAIAAYPNILARYKMIHLPANWTIPAATRLELEKVANRLVVDKPLVAGTLDEYGRHTAPLIAAGGNSPESAKH